MDFLSELCKKHSISLIGDSCDSIGSKWDGKHLSEYYEAWTSSFYPAHHISTGKKENFLYLSPHCNMEIMNALTNS